MSDSPTTEATVLANLVKWSEDCPDWQRDALRRLCTAPELDDTDATELLAICRGDAAGTQIVRQLIT
ncbi:hypothetical protein [Bradyrhizobium japonicum]|uniref:hypothetical protein n=1 Tax=Bradyrhizobium japonicum TaxID=375 RepID=UPI002714D48E|nr:hypothetical protein [Bradyrhizobium japonicum]WLB23965.1 hypothetical protein QIH95_49285 [Bradyrhizobium japonicum]